MKLILINEATIDQVQNRIPIWINKYFNGDSNLAGEIIPDIIVADPTKGKYSEWLLRQWKSKSARFPEDIEKLAKNLKLFDIKKSKLDEKDINKYTASELAKTLDKQFNLTKSERQSARKGGIKLPPGAELIGRINKWKIVKITDSKASTLLCSGTEWCTANADAALHYLESGPLYLFYRRNERSLDGGYEREYLVHIPSWQFMDVYDEMASNFIIARLVSTLAELDPDALKGNIKEIVNNLLIFNPRSERPLIKKIILNQEYLKDVDENVLYSLVLKLKGDVDNDVVAFRKWYEQHLLKNPSISIIIMYINNVRRSRWIEAEPIIAKYSNYILDYNMAYRNDEPWPEAEPELLKSPYAAAGYAINVLKRRWPEAEPVIKIIPDVWARYEMYVNWWNTTSEN